jgi:hypothetical protein
LTRAQLTREHFYPQHLPLMPLGFVLNRVFFAAFEENSEPHTERRFIFVDLFEIDW